MSEPRNSSNSGTTVANPELVMDVKEANAQYLLSAERQIPKGYRQTEVGVIPEDWEIGVLNRFWNVTDCKHITAPFVDHGFPVASIKEVQSRFVNLSNAKITTQPFYKLLIEGGRKPRVGDLILSRNATVGEVAQVADWHPPFAMGQDVCLLRKQIPEFSTEYLQAVFRSPIIENQLSDLMVGSTFKRVNIEQVKSFTIPMPPGHEQAAIAEVLSDADVLIEVLEQLVAKKRQLKLGAMQELLTGKRRLPGFETNLGYKQTQIGVIPEDWDVAKLGDLFEITSSKRVFQSEWKQDGVPFYRAREIAVLGETGFVENDLFINQQMYDSFRKVYGVPQVGDLLVTGVGTLGKVFVVTDNREFYFKDGNIIWFKLAGSMDSTYLQQLYLTPLVIKQITDASAGTTVGTYTITGAKNTAIPFPSNAEQTAIAQILTDMDAEITELETKLTKARAVKQGMMQQLLTGKIRLVVNPKPLIDNGYERDGSIES